RVATSRVPVPHLRSPDRDARGSGGCSTGPGDLMDVRVRAVLWAYVVLNGVLGVAFLLGPTLAAGTFPWPLPPLAARFMGSLFLAGAACALANLRLGASRGLFVLALVAVGDILIATTGLLALDAIGPAGTTVTWLILFIGVALGLLSVVVPTVRDLADV